MEIKNEFMDEYKDKKKIKLILSFIKHLYDNGGRGSVVNGTITGIKQLFLFNLKSINIFEDPIVKQGIKSTKYNVKEIVEIAKIKKSEGLIPFNTVLLGQLRTMYYVDDVWSTAADFNRKAAYLAVAISLDTAVRIGCVTLKDGKDKVDHCIRLDDVYIKVKDVSICIQGGLFKNYYMENNLSLNDVELIDLYFFSDKNTTNSGVVLTRSSNSIYKTNEIDSQLINDIINWIIHSGVKAGDELLTRYFNGHRKVITRKEVTNAIKYVGQCNNIPSKRLNTRSLRKGFATGAAMSGLSEDQVKAKGGWSSKVAKLHYTSNFHNTGLLSLDNQYGMEELQRNI